MCSFPVELDEGHVFATGSLLEKDLASNVKLLMGDLPIHL